MRTASTRLRGVAARVTAALVLAAGLGVGCDDDGGGGTLNAADSGGGAPDISAPQDGGGGGDTGSPSDLVPSDLGPSDGVTPSPDVPDVPVQGQPCSDAADCDDGAACTVDTCESGACVYSVAADTCFVGGLCRAAAEAKPGDPCSVCNPAADRSGWSPATNGTPCDAGDACLEAGQCQGGVCAGGAEVDCEDNDPCTADSCDSAFGCVYAPGSDAGIDCDDGSLCTTGDVCTGAGCVGTPVVCDDDEPCTDDICDAQLGCVTEFNEAPCEDGDLCTAGDTCSEGGCVAGPPADCADGNNCTIDLCEPQIGCAWLPTQSPCCVGEASVCEDNNPCTVDLCDLATAGCSYQDVTEGSCDDGDPCTVEDACSAMATCEGVANACDDDNVCTADSCVPGVGCSNVPVDGGCDDGMECSTGDACVEGVCVADTTGCVLCDPELPPVAAKMTVVALGNGGHPGQGLDLDGDPMTCAPETDCSAGINNNLGVLGSIPQVGDALAAAVTGGSLMLLAGFYDLDQPTLTASVFQAELDPSNVDCDFQNASCSYQVSESLFDPTTCAPLVSLPGTLTGDQLVAGGEGTSLPFAIPLGDAQLDVVIFDVQLVGTLTMDGGTVTGLTGVLGGAIPKDVLLAAVDNIPAGTLPDGIEPSTIAFFLGLIDNDIDTDGDDVLDALSIGIVLEGIGATVTGVAP